MGFADVAVTDAGPVIHLLEIGCLHFLDIFDTVYLPTAVWQETVESGRVAAQQIEQLRSIQRIQVPGSTAQFVTVHNLTHLHFGEQACLHLCEQLGLKLLLTDDLAVRQVAKQRGVTPVGSLGVVVRAYRLGIISLDEAEGCLNDLYASSTLFITRTIVDLALERLKADLDKR